MRIFQINSVGNLSTGNIMCALHRRYSSQGNDCMIAYAKGESPQGIPKYSIGGNVNRYFHALMTRLDGRTGFYSRRATSRLIKKLREFDPDIIHLHNIHGYYLNIEMLFKYLSSEFVGEVRWTLHDCWSFTGHCAYFTYVGCEQWKTGCGHSSQCPQLRAYPKTYRAVSCKKNFIKKKELFTSVEKMTLITPSQWLKDLVSESFLACYPVVVQRNEVDARVFKKTPSDIKERLGLNGRKVALSVASTWEPRKGLEDLIELSDLLGDSWIIVVVGLTKKQRLNMPKRILSLGKAKSTNELAELYTMADVLINPTYEDNLPTVNLEAEACGTPVLAYDVGGNRETISFPNSKIIIPRDNKLMITAIENISS